jgi:hypothetical protein
MISFRSFQKRLTEELDNIEAAIIDLWRKSRIEEFRNDPYSSVVVITHRYYWQTLAAEHRDAQAQLIAKYRHWCELFNRWVSQHGGEVKRDIEETNNYVTSAIELQTERWETWSWFSTASTGPPLPVSWLGTARSAKGTSEGDLHQHH